MQAEDQNRKATNREDATLRERSFDELAKGLAGGTISRLHALRFIGASLLGGLLAAIPGVSSAQSAATTDNASIATAGDTIALAQEEAAEAAGEVEEGGEVEGEVEEGGEVEEEPGAVAESGRGCPPGCLPTRFYELNSTIITSPGTQSFAGVRCDPGDRVLNGGYQIQGDRNFFVSHDIVFTETDANGVVTQRYVFGLVELGNRPRQVFITVVCADVGTPH